jgi:MFS family permease
VNRVNLLPRLDGLPPAYWYLWAGALINRIGAFVIPFLSIYLTSERHLSAAEAGAIISTWGAGSLGAGPVGGFIADRWGRRRALIFALSAGAAAMLALGFARTLPEIAVATFLLGFFGEIYRPAVSAAIADLVPPEDRGRAYGFLYWAINFGFAVGPVIASRVVKHGYLTLFIADAATTLMFAAVVWARVPETQTRHEQHRLDWRAPYLDRLFSMFVAISFVAAVVFSQHLVGLPIDMSAHGIDAAQYGNLICVNGILIILVQPLAAQWLERFPKSRVLAVGALLVGIGFGATALVHAPAGYVASIAIWSLGEIALLPVATTVIAELSPTSLRASYQGMYQLSWGAAFFVAPTLSGAVFTRFGARTLWAGCFVAAVLVSLAHLALGPARRKRIAQLAHQ